MSLNKPPVVASLELQRLDFMVGEFEGTNTLHGEDGEAHTFSVHWSGSREECDIYLMVRYFAEIAAGSRDATTAMYTFHQPSGEYRLYVFSSNCDDPCYFRGQWQDGQLQMVSDPAGTWFGMQRHRFTIAPTDDGFSYLVETWTPDGHQPAIEATLRALGAPY